MVALTEPGPGVGVGDGAGAAVGGAAADTGVILVLVGEVKLPLTPALSAYNTVKVTCVNGSRLSLVTLSR